MNMRNNQEPTNEHKRRAALPAHLPRVQRHHEPDKTACGCRMARIAEDVCEQLDYTHRCERMRAAVERGRAPSQSTVDRCSGSCHSSMKIERTDATGARKMARRIRGLAPSDRISMIETRMTQAPDHAGN